MKWQISEWVNKISRIKPRVVVVYPQAALFTLPGEPAIDRCVAVPGFAERTVAHLAYLRVGRVRRQGCGAQMIAVQVREFVAVAYAHRNALTARVVVAGGHALRRAEAHFHRAAVGRDAVGVFAQDAAAVAVIDEARHRAADGVGHDS